MEVNLGKFIPGVPWKPISPGNQLSRHGSSVSEASSTERYESYWRVHEKEQSKLQQLKNASPAAPEQQPSPHAPPAAVEEPPATVEKSNVEPGHGKVASIEQGKGGGDGESLGDTGKTPPEVPNAAKAVNKFDKYYHQILDCFGHQNFLASLRWPIH